MLRVPYLMTNFDHQTIPKVWIPGAAMAMSRRALDRLRGFDERFFLSFENGDICRWAEAQACMEHLIGGSREKLPFRALARRLESLAYILIIGRLAALVSPYWTATLAVPTLRLELGAHKTTK